MHARHPCGGFVIGVFVIASAGCSGFSAPVPGVTYSVAAITRADRGPVSQPEPALTVESAVVDDVEEVVHGGSTLAVHVRKTQYGKATFTITFPDKSTQTVQVRKGETKDILPRGQQVGVRLAVQEAR